MSWLLNDKEEILAGRIKAGEQYRPIQRCQGLKELVFGGKLQIPCRHMAFAFKPLGLVENRVFVIPKAQESYC